MFETLTYIHIYIYIYICHKMAESPEPLHKMATMRGVHESSAVMDIMPQCSAVMDAKSVYPDVMNDVLEASKAVPRQPRLMSSVVDPP